MNHQKSQKFVGLMKAMLSLQDMEKLMIDKSDFGT